jgi:DnaD/phage-associated family protein
MFVLESKYGNDGYAFWFKLLEVLGSTNGMYYDCNNVADWEFLLAKTHLSSETVTDILNILADLEAIDQDLWLGKIIWSQNLVDNVKDSFKRRSTETPIKPSFCIQKPTSSDVSDDINGEKKRKEKKEKEKKGEESNTETSPPPQQDDVKKIMDFYKENFGARAVPAQVHMLLSFLDDNVEADLVIEALSITVNAQKFDLRYTEKILINWSNQGIKTLEQYKEHEARRGLQKKASQGITPDKPKQKTISEEDIEAAIFYINMELTEFKEANKPTDDEIQEFLNKPQFGYEPEVKKKALERLNLMQYWQEVDNG